MIADLIRAAIRACDAATRAYEAMADHFDEVTPAIVRNQDSSAESNRCARAGSEAFLAAEEARKNAWVKGSVSGPVVTFRKSEEDGKK